MFAGSEAGAGIAADIDLGAATREARFKRAPIPDRALARAIRAGGETRAGAFIARRRQFTIRLRLPGCTPTVRKRIQRDRARMHRSLPHRPSAPVIPAPARMAARPVAESSAGLSAHACRAVFIRRNLWFAKWLTARTRQKARVPENTGLRADLVANQGLEPRTCGL
ncbi:hypothetical protein [Burkholderia pseudomallei]|uniref:hypothetical protein n=1 Tax=Burkholderia pseudomallei TaxID=28450 RepID=UPI0015615E4F|nr:hypothetical protein [Burkholderia pseudomallei]